MFPYKLCDLLICSLIQFKFCCKVCDFLGDLFTLEIFILVHPSEYMSTDSYHIYNRLLIQEIRSFGKFHLKPKSWLPLGDILMLDAFLFWTSCRFGARCHLEQRYSKCTLQQQQHLRELLEMRIFRPPSYQWESLGEGLNLFYCARWLFWRQVWGVLNKLHYAIGPDLLSSWGCPCPMPLSKLYSGVPGTTT